MAWEGPHSQRRLGALTPHTVAWEHPRSQRLLGALTPYGGLGMPTLTEMPGGTHRRTVAWEAHTHPMYCRGWLWWITILQVGQVLFSSRYFTRQLLQTVIKAQVC